MHNDLAKIWTSRQIQLRNGQTNRMAYYLPTLIVGQYYRLDKRWALYGSSMCN